MTSYLLSDDSADTFEEKTKEDVALSVEDLVEERSTVCCLVSKDIDLHGGRLPWDGFENREERQ